MSEFKLVPASMHLDRETIGAINFHCGDGADGQFGEYSHGLLWVGVVTDDEGKEVYGLHLATAEYPEEGSTTLVEFNAPSDAGEVARLTAERDALQQRLNAADQRIDEMAAAAEPFAMVADLYAGEEDDSFEPARDVGMHDDLRLTLGQFRALNDLCTKPLIKS